MQRKHVPPLRGRRRLRGRWYDDPSPPEADSGGLGMLPAEEADEELLLTQLAWQATPAGFSGLTFLVFVAVLRLGAAIIRGLFRMATRPYRRVGQAHASSGHR